MRFSAEDKVVEIRAKSSSDITTWAVNTSSTVSLWATARSGDMVVLNSWWATELLMEDHEQMAKTAMGFLTGAEVRGVGLEEMTSAFAVARKEAIRMLAVLYMELLVSHVGREEVVEAWDEANALRVMAG